MIETLQIPVLLKAIDFIFDEGRKILDERRERRRAQESAPREEPQEPAPEAVALEVQEQEQIKQDLLASKIDEILWQNHQWEIERLVKLLEKYSRNYYLATEQYATWGSALVPPIIVHNLTEAENSMESTMKRLEDLLSKVYKKDIIPNK